MRREVTLSKHDFDKLLKVLSPDKDEAGKKYEELRDRLIRFFRFRGCTEAEELADETLDRVARKLAATSDDGDLKLVPYVYGFASNIILEYRAKSMTGPLQLRPELVADSDASAVSPVRDEVTADACLEKCLSELPPEESRIIVLYYKKDKSEKFEHRKGLCEIYGLSPEALYTRVHRTRVRLKKCIEDCMNQNKL